MPVSLDLVLVSFCCIIRDNYKMIPDVRGNNTLIAGGEDYVTSYITIQHMFMHTVLALPKVETQLDSWEGIRHPRTLQ